MVVVYWQKEKKNSGDGSGDDVDSVVHKVWWCEDYSGRYNSDDGV